MGDTASLGTAPSASLLFQDCALLARLHSVTSPLVAVVDDDEALCSSLVDLMRSIGCRAEPHISAEAFLTSSALLSFDCVIADVHMPGMGGLDLVRKLHEQGIMTPVILITALPDKRLDDEAIAAGAQCLLRKPFETASLLDWVERSLSNDRPTR
jgi:FixJ family two-component response regulator